MFEPLPLRQDSPAKTEALLEQLEKCTSQSQKKGRVYKNPHKITTNSGSDLTVNVWKWPEHNFSKKDLPCYARGLFTAEGRIIVRGYDKFFNVDEVPATKSAELKQLTGPFEVATKENGCIVFISGLADGTLVVCSKNSTGEVLRESTIGDKTSRHYLRARASVFEQLEKANKLPADFARLLYENNITAVAELCDDEFEEHVVEYPKELAGLYLHGINANTADFFTYPGEKVDSMADDWGFRKVQREVFPDYSELWLFLTATAASGTYRGREIEGFVVRSFNDENKPFFFKFKFEEPYSLFRQLRETAKDLLSADNKYSLVEIALKYPKHQRLTQAWLLFAQSVFEKDEQRAIDFQNDKGIILLRHEFMESLGVRSNDGIRLVTLNEDDKISQQFEQLVANTDFKFVVASVSFLGCGKTTTFQVLANLMPEVFSHVQSDNVRQKKAFPSKCMEALKDHRVVLADKNIHTSSDRASFPKDCRRVRSEWLPPLTGLVFVAVNFVQRTGVDRAFDIAAERIKKRGNNHQTLRYDEQWKQQTMNIMLDFKNRFRSMQVKDPSDENSNLWRSWQLCEPDDCFDLVVNAEISEDNSSLLNAQELLRALRETYPTLASLEWPTESQWEEAYQKALAYKPEPGQIIPMASYTPKHRPEYYGVAIDEAAKSRLIDLISRTAPLSNTWHKLVEESRIKEKLHVTLGHLQAAHENDTKKELWNDLGRKYEVHVIRKQALPGERKPVGHFIDMRVTRLVVVAEVLVVVEVELLANYRDENGKITPWKDRIVVANDHLHITLGTADEEIQASESNYYLARLHQKGLANEGNYAVGTDRIEVFNVDLLLEKQQVYIQFK